MNACVLGTEIKHGGSVHFFIYDVIKIMVLLGRRTDNRYRDYPAGSMEIG